MKTTRRSLLQLLAATAATTAASRAFANHLPLTTWEPAAGWGAFGAPRRVLEIFLRGGASMWEGYWYDATLGAATGDTTLTTTVGGDWDTITGLVGNIPPRLGWMGFTMGRAAAPIRRAVDNGFGVLRRMSAYTRVIRVGHDLLPHEAAIPYAATGTTLGRTHQSGLGAAIWRRADEQEGVAGVRSIILQSGGQSGDDLAARYAASTGNHGPEFAPPIITLGDPAFYDALPRSGLTASDALKGFYRDRFAARLQFPGTTEPVRSDGWAAYRSSLDTMITHHQALHDLLAPYSANLFPDPAVFVPNYHDDSLPRNAIEAALGLLSTTDMRHVAVIDGGVESHYDTHNAAAGRTVPFIQNGNLWSTLDALADNLNTILDHGIAVLIHSEFGRIEREANTGTEHHTGGYVNVVVSDLVTSPGFAGDIDATDPSLSSFTGGALDALTPTDVHAAVASIAGIEPWQPDMFDGDADLACLPGANEADELLAIP